MLKRKIVETTKEFDSEGRVVRETITETEETDDNDYRTYSIPLSSVDKCQGSSES